MSLPASLPPALLVAPPCFQVTLNFVTSRGPERSSDFAKVIAARTQNVHALPVSLIPLGGRCLLRVLECTLPARRCLQAGGRLLAGVQCSTGAEESPPEAYAPFPRTEFPGHVLRRAGFVVGFLSGEIRGMLQLRPEKINVRAPPFLGLNSN